MFGLRLKPLITIIITGIIGGILIASLLILFIPFITESMWSNILLYNWSVRWIPFSEGIILGILILFVLSILSSHIIRSEITSVEIAAKYGTCCGIITGLTSTSLLIVSLLQTKGFIYQLFYIETAIPIICGAIIVQVFGAYIPYITNSGTRNGQKKPDHFLLNDRILPIFSLIVLIATGLIIIVSPTIVLLGIQSGDIDRSPCCATLFEIIKFDRIDNNSIQIQMEANPENYLEWAPKPVFHISVNSNDLSNMNSIQEYGLPDVIYPPEGLIYSNHSSVILKGPTVSNITQPIHVIITEKFSKRTSRIIADFMV